MTQTETEELWCKVGGHFWNRPKGTRGRKPVACTQHQSKEVTPPVTPSANGQADYATYGEITKPGTVRLVDDGFSTPVVNGPFTVGDKGMAELRGDDWSFTVFEPAAPKKDTKPRPAKQKAADKPSEPQGRIVETEAPKEDAEVKRARLEKARATKEKNRIAAERERSQVEQAAAKLEYAQIGDRIAEASRQYDDALKAFNRAKREEDATKAWHRLQSKQNAEINLLARQRVLKSVWGFE